MHTSGHELEAALLQAVGQSLGVLQHLLLVRLELRACRLLQRARQPSDGVVVRATLHQDNTS